jgi:hypothetical protein
MTAVIETKPVNRRDAVKRLAALTVVMAIAPLAQACDSLDEERSAAGGGALVAATTEGLFGHVHRLAIARRLLERPPAEGVLLETTRALLHRHEVRLSAAELSAIAAGRTVTRQMSSHRLVICLACAVGRGSA